MTTNAPWYSLDAFPDLEKSIHLAIGVFDGVHLGHRAVINTAIDSASSSEGLAGVLTFAPHPSRILRPDEPTLMIASREQKQLLLSELRIDFIIELPFSLEFAKLSAQEFLPMLKGAVKHLATLHVGENFRFGKGRLGNIDAMVSQAQELDLHVMSVPRVKLDGEAISSTRIRKALQSVSIEEVNQLLGYGYFIQGAIFSPPASNYSFDSSSIYLRWEPELKPSYGNYAARLFIGSDIYLLEVTYRFIESAAFFEIPLREDFSIDSTKSIKLELLASVGLWPY